MSVSLEYFTTSSQFQIMVDGSVIKLEFQSQYEDRKKSAIKYQLVDWSIQGPFPTTFHLFFFMFDQLSTSFGFKLGSSHK